MAQTEITEEFVNQLIFNIEKHKQLSAKFAELLEKIQENCKHDFEVIGHTHLEINRCKICKIVITA